MSASKQLRELVDGFYDAEFPSTPGEEAPTPLVRALPEIMAVVEAAEGFFPEHLAVLQSDLPRALAALEEKLKP